MLLGEDSKQTYTARVPLVLHLPELARKLIEAYLQLADWNQLRRMGECRSEPLRWTTSPEIVGWCDLFPLKNLVWDKLRDYVISRANPIPKLMFLIRVVMIW